MRSERVVNDLPDYYTILDVSPTASRDEIRAAYRCLARRHHPDVNPPDEDDVAANELMRRLNQAYAVLNDPQRRAAYDRQRWTQAPRRRETTFSHGRAESPPDKADWGPQTGGGRWRPPRSRRMTYRQSMPGWVESFMAVEEHLKMRLEPFLPLIGVVGPVVAVAITIILSFLAYKGIQDDPNAVEFLDRVIGAFGGPGVIFGVLGVVLLVFLVAWFAMWRALKG